MEDASAATTTEVGAKEAAAASASASTPNNNNNIRICLVGEVVDDEETLVAAKHFGVPLLTSETGEEYALGSNDQWITYFILKDFEGPLYEALSKSPNKYVVQFATLAALQCQIRSQFHLFPSESLVRRP